MTNKLSEDVVKKICISKGFTLIKYKNSRIKVDIKCKRCKRPDNLWWSSIRDGKGCAWCSGQKIDLNQAFIDKNLIPIIKPKHCRQKVSWKCSRCGESGKEPISEKDLKRRDSTPCWVCDSYQVKKRKLFFDKGWELFEQYEKRKKYNCVCKICGHKSPINANTVEKWKANCPVCRDLRFYKLIGNRFEELNATFNGPINLSNLKERSKAICLTCSNPSTYNFRDVVYSRQGFCKICGIESRAEKARRYDIDEILKSKNLVWMKGKYKNEESKIFYYCAVCKKEDGASVASLRVRKSNCLYCENRKLKDDPLQIFKDNELVPQESFKGHQYPTFCICLKCGEPTYPTRLNLQQGHTGCICILKDHPGVYSRNYFLSNQNHKFIPGGVYVIKFRDEDNKVFFKIGIHQAGNSRVQTHINCGGKCLSYLIAPLFYCWEIEQKIIKKMKEFKYIPKMKIKGGSKKECFTMNPDLIEPSFFELYNLLPKTYLNEGQDPSKLARKIFKTLFKKPQLSLDDVT